MGLFDNPETLAQLSLAAGLLGGGNLGQAAQRGLLGYQQTLDGATDRKAKQALMGAQLSNYNSEIAARDAGTQKAKDLADFIKRMGGQPSGSAPAGEPYPGYGADIGMRSTQPAPSSRPAATSGGVGNNSLMGLSLEDIAGLKLRGGPDMLEAYKYANDPQELKGGSTYQNRLTGARETLPILAPGQQFTGGQISNIPGVVDAQAEAAGATARATEAAKAGQDVVQIWDSAKGAMVFVPRSQVVSGASPQPNQAALVRSLSQGSLPPGVRAGGNVQSPAYSGGDRNAANAESIRMMQSELTKPGNSAADIAGITREIQRLQAQSGMPAGMPAASGGGYAAGPSAAEAAANKAAESRAVDTAKADVVRDTGDIKKAKSAGEMIAATRRARELLNQSPTASGAGEMADRAMAFVGRSNKGAEVASKLDIISGDLVNNVPRMEGPQSDGDRVEYKLQAGRAADRTIPVQQRIAAMDEVERLQTKYAGLNGGADTKSSPARGVNPPAPGQVVDGYRFKGGNPAERTNWEKN